MSNVSFHEIFQYHPNTLNKKTYNSFSIYKLQMESNDEVMSIILTELHLSQTKIVGTNDIPTIV